LWDVTWCNRPSTCPITKTVQPGWLSHKGWFLGGTELSHLRASTRWLFNQAKRIGYSEPYKKALTCYNKEIWNVKQSLGGTNVSGSKMYLTGLNIRGSCIVSRPTGWNLLSYLITNTHNLEKRP